MTMRENLGQQIACRMRAMAESLRALEHSRSADERLLLLGWVQESAERVQLLMEDAGHLEGGPIGDE